MKLTNLQMEQSYKTLGVLTSTRGMPSVASYRIMKNARAIESELNMYEEQRVKLCEEMAEKDEKGKPIIIDKSYKIKDAEKLHHELMTLKQEEVEVNIKPIKLDDLSCVGLSPYELELIEFMLEEEEV
jgi:hypothetical protein